VAVSDAYRAFWEKLQQGEFVTGEFRRIAKDGSTRWIQGSYNPVFNSEGVLYKVVKFASDITEAKMQDLAIEEELNRARQAEAQLRAELQSLHKQALIEICANGEIGAVSADLLKLAGYEAQELTGQPLSTLTGGDAQSANALYTQLASQQSAQQNFSIITKSGQKLLLHGYFSKVQDKAQEKMIGMLHID
jgi:methyl-accepting chemotaxis protein